LERKCDEPLSNVAFKCNVRRYNKERFAGLFELTNRRSLSLDQRQSTAYLADSSGLKFGLAGDGDTDIYISGDMSSVDCNHKVWRCSLTLPKPVLKAPMVSRFEILM
jgi:hypothetical protein